MKEINEILELIDELETYLAYRRKIVLAAQQVEKDYQRKYYTFFEYEKKLKSVLKGKKLEEWVDYYNSYAQTLLQRIKYLNTQVFYKIYHDRRIEELKAAQKIVRKEAPVVKKETVAKEPIIRKEAPVRKKDIVRKEAAPIVAVPVSEAKTKEIIPEKEQLPEFPQRAMEMPAETVIETKRMPESRAEKQEIESLKKKVEKPVKIEPALRKKAELFEKQVSEKPAEKEYFTTYAPSAIGTLANRYFRSLGALLLRKYPESFENLFKQMRFANMRILSKTYVSIILLVSCLTFAFSYLALVFAGFFSPGIYTIFVRPLAVSVIAAFAAFGITFGYPYAKAGQRAKIIDANLPFAINHMSAVATSGLPPDMMFRIVAQSKEYSEVSIELRKLVEYIDLFGYDVTTAIMSVSAVTPSRPFKEFMDGALATLTAGGDFSVFLREKSEQEMFAYRMRIEKYNETVSTYSDVYMGIMIVAPVFFIAILSLVSILGGQIFGMDIQSLIVLGTYAVIPLLNVGFLTFLEVSQPAE